MKASPTGSWLKKVSTKTASPRCHEQKMPLWDKPSLTQLALDAGTQMPAKPNPQDHGEHEAKSRPELESNKTKVIIHHQPHRIWENQIGTQRWTVENPAGEARAQTTLKLTKTPLPLH